MILSDFLSRQKHDNSNPHEVILISFNMHYLLHEKYYNTGGSHLSWIFWEHDNISGLSVIWLIYIKLYKEKEKNLAKNIWANVGIQLNHCMA